MEVPLQADRAGTVQAVLVSEGEIAKAIFIVETGRLEVLKSEEDGGRAHRIAVLRPGMSAGEIALLDAGARSATVRALEDSRVLVIPIHKLRGGLARRLPFDVQMMVAFGRDLAKRLRSSNEITVRSLQDSLDHLRLSVKYLVFDLEATRRENTYLRKMLRETPEDDHEGAD